VATAFGTMAGRLGFSRVLDFVIVWTVYVKVSAGHDVFSLNEWNES